jgi:hypothetical protein
MTNVKKITNNTNKINNLQTIISNSSISSFSNIPLIIPQPILSKPEENN